QYEDVDTVFGMPRHLEISTEDSAMVQLREARAMIEAMETSKFWKLRSRWFQIKNWVKITKT
ncbi:MAG: hypothetical protein RLZZ171_98, partial [Cyanobacteriota bacterium]